MELKAIIDKSDDGYFQVYSKSPVPCVGAGKSEDKAKEDYLAHFKKMTEISMMSDGKRPEWTDAEVEFVYDYNMKTVHRSDASLRPEQKKVLVRLMDAMENLEGAFPAKQPETLTVTVEPHEGLWTGLVFNQEDTKGLEVRLREDPQEAIRDIRTWLKDLCDDENAACSTLVAGHDNAILLHYEDGLCAVKEDADVTKRQGSFVVLTDAAEEPAFALCCTRGELILTLYEAFLAFIEDKAGTPKIWSKSLFVGPIGIELSFDRNDSPVDDFRSITVEDTIY